jgi:hypothetical protein
MAEKFERTSLAGVFAEHVPVKTSFHKSARGAKQMQIFTAGPNGPDDEAIVSVDLNDETLRLKMPFRFSPRFEDGILTIKRDFITVLRIRVGAPGYRLLRRLVDEGDVPGTMALLRNCLSPPNGQLTRGTREALAAAIETLKNEVIAQGGRPFLPGGFVRSPMQPLIEDSMEAPDEIIAPLLWLCAPFACRYETERSGDEGPIVTMTPVSIDSYLETLPGDLSAHDRMAGMELLREVAETFPEHSAMSTPVWIKLLGDRTAREGSTS